MDNALPADLTGFDLGPYHGQYEWHAKFLTWITLIESAGLIVFPWCLAWIGVLHHPARSFLGNLHPIHVISLDCLGASGACVFYSVYRRLSAKIAEGGPECVFLDNIRIGVASLGQIAFSLVMMMAADMLR